MKTIVQQAILTAAILLLAGGAAQAAGAIDTPASNLIPVAPSLEAPPSRTLPSVMIHAQKTVAHQGATSHLFKPEVSMPFVAAAILLVTLWIARAAQDRRQRRAASQLASTYASRGPAAGSSARNGAAFVDPTH